MAVNSSNGGGKSPRKSFKLYGVIFLVVAAGGAAVWLNAVRGGRAKDSDMPVFAAQRGPLTISVLESGTIKAREQEVIYNEVEGRTTIVRIVPEGTRVKKGDMLFELDVSTLTDTRIDREISTQNAEASYINAKENLEVVKNQEESDLDAAQLTLEFAEQDLRKYKEGQYPNDLAKAKNEITLTEQELTKATNTLQWSEKLYQEKYISQTELQSDQLTASRAHVSVEVAKNDLRLLESFTYGRQIAQLESAVRQARMALERTVRKGRANVVQAEADLRAKEQEWNRQKDKLAKTVDQIAKAKVLAPRDGMVIYATSGDMMDDRRPLQQGVEVSERQEMIYLPTAQSAKAEVSIHEASLDKIRPGLPAIVTVDALPKRKYLGTLARIAPLPDPQSMWMNPDLKVYISDVHLDTNDPDLRTGMGCKVEVVVEQYDSTIYVPVQSVVQVHGRHTVYVVKEDRTAEERAVEIGLDDLSMVAILHGLNEGEVVLLTPPLKDAAVLSRQAEESGDSNEAAGSMRRTINRKLDEAGSTDDGDENPGPAGGQAGDAEQGSRASRGNP